MPCKFDETSTVLGQLPPYPQLGIPDSSLSVDMTHSPRMFQSATARTCMHWFKCESALAFDAAKARGDAGAGWDVTDCHSNMTAFRNELLLSPLHWGFAYCMHLGAAWKLK